ncbi:hypothetical protein GUJ93_ZPchr0458g22819 [Zizania palustris]|uniref:Uncharacterized protein n=1 Tax=Zizania palustris TaxID=103762 RepID=A0A8J5R1Z2_ZIZPA|nr:hypothetical protein GUJ93_ZPchr0458g22819 [Zizania palustris]
MSESSADTHNDGEPESPAAEAKQPSVAAADDDEVTRFVPRVIRTAAAAAGSSLKPPHPGYSPKLSIDMARAHSWAPYVTVIPALRSLSLARLVDEASRGAAREAISELYKHAKPPFDAAGRRFPAGEVYVCLDRAPLAANIQSIQRHLMMAEASPSYSDNLSNIVEGYMTGVSNAIDALTADDRWDPVLYDREGFESAFLLTWTEP